MVDIDLAAVRGDRHAQGTTADGDRRAITVLVAVSITDTVLSLTLVDIDLAAVRGDRHAKGSLPTGIVAITVLVAVSITDTVLD